jgi:MoxR-like ATPase
MEEHQVSLEGVTYKLEEPFMVIATQNPVETKGTFDLPEAQLDRFLIKTSMGYPTHEESVEILSRKLGAKPIIAPEEKIDKESIFLAQSEVASVYVHQDLLSYAADLCEATRHAKDVVLGASPRAMIALLRVAQGFAAISDRDYMLPDDIKKAAVPVLAHRIVFHNSFFHREDMGKTLIKSLLDSVAVPSESIDFSRRYAE